MLRYAYFPGCSMNTTGTTYRMSIEYIASKIGLELLEIPDWNCCGATAAHSKGKYLSLALPARNLSIAENKLPGLDICVPCASCYSRMLATTHALRTDADAKEKIQSILDSHVQGSAEILTLLDVLGSQEAMDKMKEQIIRPLKGLKVACYYGCLTTRPHSITGTEPAKMECPMDMENILSITGVECVDWAVKTECCGGSHQVDAPPQARPLVTRLFRNAKANGAQAIITACPMCNLNLDMREEEINMKLGTAYDMPVYQFTEILAIAMGANAKQVGLQKHFYPAFKRIDQTLRKAGVD